MNQNQRTNKEFDSHNPPADWLLSDDAACELLEGTRPFLSPEYPGLYSLSVPLGVTYLIKERAGFDRTAMLRHSMYVWLAVPQTPALLAVLEKWAIYGTHDGPKHYRLELLENGSLYLKYQQILGGRKIAQIPKALVDQLVERIAAELPGVLLPALAKKGVKAASTRTVADDMSQLTVVDGRIKLPSERLHHYGTLKRLLEQAGASYNAGGSFSFPPGIDATEVLGRLMAGEKINVQQQTQFFATPESLARKMVTAAISAARELGHVLMPAPKVLDGVIVLEPEAGQGALALVARELGAKVVCVESYPVNAAVLRERGFEVHERDFLSLSPADLGGKFSVIIANPPFSRSQDIAHVRHMLDFLAPDGVLSVLTSTAWVEGTQRAHESFRELLQQYNVVQTPVPAGTFRESGTQVGAVHLLISNPVPMEPEIGSARLELLEV
ncbi:hypothetical protein [Paraburkholderia sp. SIMBA_054]|uniref:hypothetical protein n=1 Tax=Paraburkholderia sp. SIMBA_054 TaxID=3085795 RepID=UPI003978D928